MKFSITHELVIYRVFCKKEILGTRLSPKVYKVLKVFRFFLLFTFERNCSSDDNNALRADSPLIAINELRADSASTSNVPTGLTTLNYYRVGLCNCTVKAAPFSDRIRLIITAQRGAAAARGVLFFSSVYKLTSWNFASCFSHRISEQKLHSISYICSWKKA